MADETEIRPKDLPTKIDEPKAGGILVHDSAADGTEGLKAEYLINLALSLAPKFDATKPNGSDGYAYHVNDPVVYQGRLYRFTVNKTTGAWDASKVEEIDVEALLNEKAQNVLKKISVDTADDNLFSIVDSNNYVIAYWDKDGFFHSNGIVTPDDLSQFVCHVETADDNLFSIVDSNNYVIAYWDKDGFFHSKIKFENNPLSEEIIVPNKLYTYNGDLLQLFRYPMLIGHPYNDIDWTINIKSNDSTLTKKCRNIDRYVEFQLTSPGNVTVSSQIVDRFLNVIDERTFEIETMNVSNPLTPKNVLLIGDSITQGITNNSGITVAQGASEEAEFPYANELKRLLSDDSGFNEFTHGLNLSNVRLIGTRNTSNGRNEGYSGWLPSSFMSSSSPFYINGSIDFNAYLQQDSVYDDTSAKGVDVIYILLGANVGVNIENVDGKFILAASTYKSQMASLINAIKSQLIDDSGAQYYNPNLKIVLLSYPLPYTSGSAYHRLGTLPESDGNFMAKKYHAYSLANFELKNMYDIQNIDAVEMCTQIDSENGFAYIMKPKNVYSSETEKVLIEQIHPNSNAYKQYAKAVLRDIIHRIN